MAAIIIAEDAPPVPTVTQATTATATTAAVTTAMTIPQNVQAANSNVLATNHITATATVRGSTIPVAKTVAILRLENVKRIPATMIPTQATAVTMATATTEILPIRVAAVQLLKTVNLEVLFAPMLKH